MRSAADWVFLYPWTTWITPLVHNVDCFHDLTAPAIEIWARPIEWVCGFGRAVGAHARGWRLRSRATNNFQIIQFHSFFSFLVPISVEVDAGVSPTNTFLMLGD
jgi:hypothetical protein